MGRFLNGRDSMTNPKRAGNLLAQLEHLNEQQLRRLLVEHLTKHKLGLYWEASAIERDAALNANLVLPRLVTKWSHSPPVRGKPVEPPLTAHRNLIIEGDNFDSLRLLRATHAGKIRVIYIDPPYNTGNKDWVYNDRYVGANDRWRHSQWLEFLYRRLTLARDLLTTDGVILVSINDENRARLELLMDEVFPGMRVGSLVWKKRRSSNAAGVEHFYSCDHEHILVYGTDVFEFSGSGKNWDKYDQWDENAQDWWTSTQLTLGFNRQQRPNLFYPLHNPDADIWYPCDTNRVWARASAAIHKGKEVRTETMEELIKRNGVSFPDEKSPAFYSNVEEIQAAIKSGAAPRHLEFQDDFSFWVGKRIGFGKPRFKTYKTKVRSESQPLSSWVQEAGKVKEYDSEESFLIASGLTSEGTRVLRDLYLTENFPYPKPVSLIKNLLSQASRPTDIILDFFAGSGTTGQAVLELNAEDDGQRRFILCSSTEATAKEPDKNLCRDVCAERMRRVMRGYGGKAGYTPEQGGEFAYLQLDRVEVADAHFEADIDHAFQLLALKRLGVAFPAPEGAVKRLGRVEDCELLVCNEINAATIKTLAAWPKKYAAARLAVYSTRPDTLRERLAVRGVEANCYSLMDALLRGQMGNQGGERHE